MDYDEYDAILQHIYASAQWQIATTMMGAIIRVDEDMTFRYYPYDDDSLLPFHRAVEGLNPAVAVVISNAAIQAALSKTELDQDTLYLDLNTRIQILDSIEQLPFAEKDQCGAFIREDGTLIVWDENLDNIINHCKEFEEKMMKLIWRLRTQPASASASVISLTRPQSALSRGNSMADLHASSDEKGPSTIEFTNTDLEKPVQGQRFWTPRIMSKREKERKDKKMAEQGDSRSMRLLSPFYSGLAAAVALYFIIDGVAILLGEYALDGDASRFGLVATTPFLVCISLFFFQQVVGNLSMIFGPVAQYHSNSLYYSAVAPDPNPDVDNNLPHVTIQLPVYKESLELTIAPSVFSIKKAMQTYARQGGTSSIFVCDDGLQLLDDNERESRILFYANHNIGWVARPGHSSAPDGFKRAGRFKKASNMNYGLALSLKLEKHLAELEEAGATEEDLGETLEDKAMALAAEEIFESTGRRFKPWACNGKALRVGEIILIIDSDTVVPEDCFRDAAREMAASPELAIIQHESDVMQVAHHYFENGITHFTRRINKCISMGCSNGDVAPFVGHNAFLRWSAVQDASFVDDAGDTKQWSESHVSEDFDLALRLLLKNYTIRWATYSAGGFKEGVSLTVVDELARWEKYAYGCNELLFNPIIQWPFHGPISKQIRVFVWSRAPFHYKLQMMAYMFSYYGIGISAVTSLMNYWVLGLVPFVDRFYLHSFEIFIGVAFVFPILGNIAFTVLEFRLGQRGLLSSFIENFRWIPFFFFFFGGLSIHVSIALLSHLFSYNITWGATTKEVEKSTFWDEVPRIFQRFWFSMIVCFASMIAMIIMSTDIIPIDWRITYYQWPLILPLAVVIASHILLPIALNPWLIKFSY